MAEIEFSVLSRSCLRQRIPDQETLGREVQALVRERNAAQSIINWRFNTQNARTKLHRLYPFDSKVDRVLACKCSALASSLRGCTVIPMWDVGIG